MSYLRFSPREYQAICDVCHALNFNRHRPTALRHLLVRSLTATVPDLAIVPRPATAPLGHRPCRPGWAKCRGEPECYAGLCRRRCLGCSAAATGGTPRHERAKERRDG